jgi:single-strand DNA-binding protein
MSSLNRAELLGNVGKDPEVRSTQSGDRVASLSLATSERWKDREGEKQERTTWHNVVVWGPLADVVDRYVKKGSKLYVSGSLQTRKWQGKDGADRYTTEVVLRGFDAKLILLGDRSGGQERGDAHEPQRGEDTSRYGYAGPQQPAGGGDDRDLDADIPF